jgi:hypothetical protein
MGKFFCAFGNCGYTKYDDYDINHTSTTATSRSATSTSTSRKRLRQLKNSGQRLCRHLHPRNSRCNYGREEKESRNQKGTPMIIRRRSDGSARL